MSKHRETRGFSGDFHRHYHSNRDYLQEARDSSHVMRKKSRRITFINIFILAIIFISVNFFQKKESNKNSTTTLSQESTIFTYQLENQLQKNIAIISLGIAPMETGSILTPFSVSLAWQNVHNTFARYQIVDDSLWDSTAQHYIITHEEPALPGAILYVTIVKDNLEPLIIIKKME